MAFALSNFSHQSLRWLCVFPPQPPERWWHLSRVFITQALISWSDELFPISACFFLSADCQVNLHQQSCSNMHLKADEMSLSSLFILKSKRIFQSMTLGFFAHCKEKGSKRSHLGCQRTVLKELNSVICSLLTYHETKNMECLNHFSFPRSKWLLEYSLQKLLELQIGTRINFGILS